ncbi:S6 modification enzyme RimK, partial [Dysosmobacter welbionis]
ETHGSQGTGTIFESNPSGGNASVPGAGGSISGGCILTAAAAPLPDECPAAHAPGPQISGSPGCPALRRAGGKGRGERGCPAAHCRRSP